jgi:hypothetical protein
VLGKGERVNTASDLGIVVIVKVCKCGQKFTETQWRALPLVGKMDYEEDGDKRLELRNCPCGSTIAIEHPAK